MLDNVETQLAIYVFIFSIFWCAVATGAYISASRTNQYRIGMPFFVLRGIRTKETMVSQKTWNQAHQGISRLFKRGAALFAALTIVSLLSIVGLVSVTILLVVTTFCVIGLIADAAIFRKFAVQRAIAANNGSR